MTHRRASSVKECAHLDYRFLGIRAPANEDAERLAVARSTGYFRQLIACVCERRHFRHARAHADCRHAAASSGAIFASLLVSARDSISVGGHCSFARCDRARLRFVIVALADGEWRAFALAAVAAACCPPSRHATSATFDRHCKSATRRARITQNCSPRRSPTWPRALRCGRDGGN